MCAHFISNLVFLCLSACVCAWKRVKCHSARAHNRMGWLFSYATLMLLMRKNIRVIDSTALCLSLSIAHTLKAGKKTEAKIIIRRNESINLHCIMPTKIVNGMSFIWNHLPLAEYASSRFGFCVYTKTMPRFFFSVPCHEWHSFGKCLKYGWLMMKNVWLHYILMS